MGMRSPCPGLVAGRPERGRGKRGGEPARRSMESGYRPGGWAVQTARIASSSPNPSGVAGPGLLAWYQRRRSSGETSVRLPGICRYPFGSVCRTQSRAYASHFARYSFGWWANQVISS